MKKKFIPVVLALILLSCREKNYTKISELSPEATDGKISFVDIVNCDDKIELMINYESRELWNIKLLETKKNDEIAALAFYLDRINAIDPYLGTALQKRVADPDFSFSKKSGIEHDRPYSVSFDPLLPVNCKPRVLVKEIERNIEEDPRFIVDLDYWDRISIDAKAIAILNLAILDEGAQNLDKDHWQLYARYLSAMAVADNENSMKNGLLQSPAGRQIRFTLNRTNYYLEQIASDGGTKLTSKIDQIFNSNNLKASLKKDDTIMISRNSMFTINTKSADFSINQTTAGFQSFSVYLSDYISSVPQYSSKYVGSEFKQTLDGFILTINGGKRNLSFVRFNQSYYEQMQNSDLIEFWPNMIPKSVIILFNALTMPISASATDAVTSYKFSFHLNGTIKTAVLSGAQVIQGTEFASGVTVKFDENGALIR